MTQVNYALIAFGGALICHSIYRAVSKATDTKGAIQAVFRELTVAFAGAFVLGLVLIFGTSN
jgi:hypothetical protein